MDLTLTSAVHMSAARTINKSDMLVHSLPPYEHQYCRRNTHIYVYRFSLTKVIDMSAARTKETLRHFGAKFTSISTSVVSGLTHVSGED